MPPRASPMLGSPSSSTMDRRRARAASTGGGVMRSIPLRTQESEMAVERNGMPRAPTLPAIRAVTSAEATRLVSAPKMRSGTLRAVAATLPRMARPIAAPAACPPTSRATAIAMQMTVRQNGCGTMPAMNGIAKNATTPPAMMPAIVLMLRANPLRQPSPRYTRNSRMSNTSSSRAASMVGSASGDHRNRAGAAGSTGARPLACRRAAVRATTQRATSAAGRRVSIAARGRSTSG